MRLKFSLLVLPEVSGDVLPISYQYELTSEFNRIISEDVAAYNGWLEENGLNPSTNLPKLFVLSNLYVPKILVQDDRLKICVPRIQFWVSLLPEIGTREFLQSRFLNREMVIGDSVSSVHFSITAIEDISPISYNTCMEYQSLSPIVIKAYRANHTLEFLNPNNPVFGEFLVDELIERWERYYQMPYIGSRDFRFTLLLHERRKAVTIFNDTAHRQKVVGYMIKFRLEMAPELQEFAYVAGVGNDIEYGFGYIELIRKRK